MTAMPIRRLPTPTLPARIIVKCHVVSPASIGGMRGLNSTLICLMNVSFVLGKDSYVLTMNRGAYPDINDALVTCTEVSGNSADPNAPCTAWTVDPSVTDSTGARNLARLVFSRERREDRRSGPLLHEVPHLVSQVRVVRTCC